MQVVGADASTQAVGLEQQRGKVNYLIGNNPDRWQTDVPTFARVAYRDIYPGINLVYYGSQQQLEYDFTVAPGANTDMIRLRFGGAEQLSVDRQGDLVLQGAAGTLRQHKPFVYQEVDGVRQQVAGQFVLQGQEVGFQVGAYDRGHPLVIDPVLSYSTYLGGNGADEGHAIQVDATGNIYVTGSTTSTNFPTRNPIQGYGGGTCGFPPVPCTDTFVTKIDPSQPAGQQLVYSTYLGGSGDDEGNGIAIDGGGNAYVAGTTESVNFPTTAGAFQRTIGGAGSNAFVAKLSATGSLVYSTYVGGNQDDAASGIVVDSSGNAYISGDSTSTNFPTTAGAFQRTLPGVNAAIVAKLNPSGSALVYATYLGGTQDPITGNGGNDYGIGIAVDASGNAYLTGGTDSVDFPTTATAFQRTHGGGNYDAFVTKLNPAGSALVYSSFLGGEGEDNGSSIALDSSGNAYVTGSTESFAFPTTAGAFQRTYGGGDSNAFLSKVNTTGSALVYSTYLGGGLDDDGLDVAVDGQGNAYVTGSTSSTNFPTANPVQPALGGIFNAFVTKFNTTGSALVYSTYLGGSGSDTGHGIAVDGSQNVYVTGTTTSSNFPTTSGAFQGTYGGGQSNAFVTKLADSAPPATHFDVTPSIGNPVAGNPFSLTVTALRDDGTTATDYRGTVHFSTSDPGQAVMLPVDYPFTSSDNGRHVFNNVILVTAPSQTITARDTSSGISGMATLTVVPAPANHFVFTAPTDVTSGMPFDFTLTATDPYGNQDTNYQGTVTFTTSDIDPGVVLPANYTYTPQDAGAHLFTNTGLGETTLITAGPQQIFVNDTVSGIGGMVTINVNPGPLAPRGGGTTCLRASCTAVVAHVGGAGSDGERLVAGRAAASRTFRYRLVTDT
jgi:hypothetical protein